MILRTSSGQIPERSTGVADNREAGRLQVVQKDFKAMGFSQDGPEKKRLGIEDLHKWPPPDDFRLGTT